MNYALINSSFVVANVISASPDFIDNIRQNWQSILSLADYPDAAIGKKWTGSGFEPVLPDPEIVAAEVRTKRNKRLADCDWTQLPDSPADHEAWATYRQELRDVTAQEGFPWEVVWPETP
jgi:hypothetical protein